mmetsp:Transcript_8554/g.19343  ORF Transcript_8554/g.19343 Transcript_8554/m.19343 type:complete len:257 (+) Transcript_8554:159-929(+)
MRLLELLERLLLLGGLLRLVLLQERLHLGLELRERGRRGVRLGLLRRRAAGALGDELGVVGRQLQRRCVGRIGSLALLLRGVDDVLLGHRAAEEEGHPVGQLALAVQIHLLLLARGLALGALALAAARHLPEPLCHGPHVRCLLVGLGELGLQRGLGRGLLRGLLALLRFALVLRGEDAGGRSRGDPSLGALLLHGVGNALALLGSGALLLGHGLVELLLPGDLPTHVAGVRTTHHGREELLHHRGARHFRSCEVG